MFKFKKICSKNSNMYGIVLLTLFLICAGIVNSKPTTNVSEGNTETNPAVDITTSLTPTTNCSEDYVKTLNKDANECTHNTVLSSEFENPTPNGSLIFKEYCATYPYKECFNNAISKLNDCSENENNSSFIIRSIRLTKAAKSYYTYWCHDQASRKTTYYAEGIPFCFEGKGNSIYNCIHAIQNMNECERMSKSIQCQIKALEECNITESAIKLFNSSYVSIRKACLNED